MATESRAVVLKGNRIGVVDDGAGLTVKGTLRVVQHLAAFVGVLVEPWTEVRVTGE